METIITKDKDGKFTVEVLRHDIKHYDATSFGLNSRCVSFSDQNLENLGKKVRQRIDYICNINECRILNSNHHQIREPLFEITFPKENLISYKPSFIKVPTIWQELSREEIDLFWKGFSSEEQ